MLQRTCELPQMDTVLVMMTACSVAVPLCLLLEDARWLMLTHWCLGLPVGHARLGEQLAAACDAVVTRDTRAAAGTRSTAHGHCIGLGDDDDVLGRCQL